MPNVQATENEFRSQVISWLNLLLKNGKYPFELATADPSLRTATGTRFPDVQLWINREAGDGFCGWELKTPNVRVDDPELVRNAIEKALHMRAQYFVTWNMRDAIIWQFIPDNSTPQRLKVYKPLAVRSVEDFKIPSQRIILEDRAREILDDLVRLHQEGHLTYLGADDWFFINRLIDAAIRIRPFFKKQLFVISAKDAAFTAELRQWAAKQGFVPADQEELLSIVSVQIVYQLLGRLLFFEVLRRFQPELNPIRLTNLSEEAAHQELKRKFAEIRAIDYQAIFEEDLPDRIPVPQEALSTLDAILQEFGRRDFANLPQEVLGNVFENLIPPEERHNLGQYFTKEELVDFITAFCVRHQDATILDPTCGTGTFLIRAYNRLKWQFAARDHQKLLSQIWGIDIAPFPAELATLNLYRQEISNIGNFPRILKMDFFKASQGQEYEFPPNKLYEGDPLRKIKVKFPFFDAIIGNPPYIRQEQIDKADPNYSQAVILPALARAKQAVAPDKSTMGKERQMDMVQITGQADIYASMFVHATALLKEGGRLGFVTSNSWLGAEYGKELQDFFLRNFKIVAVVESRVEPWFETAQVNTIFIILERCANKEERDRHLVKFVSVKKKLTELIPHDMLFEASKRWENLNRLIAGIESAGNEFIKFNGKEFSVEPPELINDQEDESFRIRIIKQAALGKEILAMFGAGQWGRFLRAPYVYFELRKILKDKLTPLADEKITKINRGITGGITEFFVVSPERVKEFGIEKEFLAPFLTSFRDVKNPTISPKDTGDLLFVCPLDKNELRRLGKRGALKYIEWGETQHTKGKGAVGKAGISWPAVPSVKNRQRWYDVGTRAPGDVIINRFVGERIFFPINQERIFISDTFFEVTFADKNLRDLWIALMNSTIAYLIAEVHGRVTWSAGVLYLYGPEIISLFLPDAGKIKKEDQEKILNAFTPLLKRSIKRISEEVKREDRRAFDSAVLEALGLNPAKYLGAIYDGLVDLVEARVKLGKIQVVAKREKSKKDIPKIKEEVLREVLPEGLKPFPKAFMPSHVKTKDVAVPAGRLRLGGQFLGKQDVVNDVGEKYEAKSLDEAEFILFSQDPRSHILAVPEDSARIHDAVLKYRKYLLQSREQLMRAFAMRTGDQKISERLTAEIMEELGVLL